MTTSAKRTICPGGFKGKAHGVALNKTTRIYDTRFGTMGDACAAHIAWLLATGWTINPLLMRAGEDA